MNNLKLLLRIVKRIYSSIFWYIFLALYNIKRNQTSILKEKFGSFREVHIICPGPSLDKVKHNIFKKSSLIIFVNHAVKAINLKNLEDCSKISFTGDCTRAREILNYKDKSLDKIVKVICPVNFCHFARIILEKYDFVYNIHPKLSLKYGLVEKQFKKHHLIEAPKNNVFRGYGYGSLPMALIFGLIFDPHKIHLWGCDLKNSDDKRYSNLAGGAQYHHNDITPYEKLKKELGDIESLFLTRNITMTFHN